MSGLPIRALCRVFLGGVVHWFWGDERFVPHDDPASNYRMVCEALLSRVSANDGNVHAVPTGESVA